jgi:uncharacterized protein (DUF1697 family)
MKRYAAFLRGVSPMNCKMPELKRAYERAGFEDVTTLLASGNVVFSAKAASIVAIERACEAATEKYLGRRFDTIVRPVADLRALLEADPYKAFKLKPGSKRVVTFLRKKPKAKLDLPIELHDARILLVQGSEVLSAYVPGPKGPVFMTLIEKTFGKEVTTRTWQTIQKCAR